ncbi:MAG: DUF3891 family protein [Actinomycetota bacterium]|nr:DUF3891 family protein [Actinomycetota bacterium]
MLLRELGDAVLAIGQASHAWVAGQLARAWGNQRFAAPEPREEVCLAAEQHDVGMAEWDLRPSLNPRTGRPHSFLELPLVAHLQLWTAAPAKLLSQSGYAALLVSMHGTGLNERRDLAKLSAAQRELVCEYLERQRKLQAALAEQLGADRAELYRNQRLVRTWDTLSLALCLGWQSLALTDVPATDGQLELALAALGTDLFTLQPWPFAAHRVELRCEGRSLRGRFDTEAQLHYALEHAPVAELLFTLVAR